MSNTRLLECYCDQNQLDTPEYIIDPYVVGLGITATVSIGNMKSSAFGETEEEARDEAAKFWLLDKDKRVEQLIEKIDNLSLNGSNNGYADSTKKVNTGFDTIDGPMSSNISTAGNLIGALEEISIKNGHSPPIYEELGRSGEDHNPVFTTKCVWTLKNGEQITGEGKSKTKKEAKRLAAQEVMQTFNEKTDDLSLNGSNNGCEDSTKKVNTGFDSIGSMSSNRSTAGNLIGALEEISIKNGHSPPIYEELGRSGEDHNPVFTTKCVWTLKNGQQITGEGKSKTKKEAKRLAAQEVMQTFTKASESPQNPDISKEEALNRYFENFCSTELNQYLMEEQKDYCKKLDKIAPILGCRAEYGQTSGVSNQVILKLIIIDLDYPLITVYGLSDKGVDVSKSIAAKRAVLMLKILDTNEGNVD